MVYHHNLIFVCKYTSESACVREPIHTCYMYSKTDFHSKQLRSQKRILIGL